MNIIRISEKINEYNQLNYYNLAVYFCSCGRICVTPLEKKNLNCTVRFGFINLYAASVIGSSNVSYRIIYRAEQIILNNQLCISSYWIFLPVVGFAVLKDSQCSCLHIMEHKWRCAM